jgi:hypothetical protein
MRDYIEASEGMILTDGHIYGKKIFLAEGVDKSAFYEITEEEYNAITDTDDVATEEDYQNALKEMGVKI